MADLVSNKVNPLDPSTYDKRTKILHDFAFLLVELESEKLAADPGVPPDEEEEEEEAGDPVPFVLPWQR